MTPIQSAQEYVASGCCCDKFSKEHIEALIVECERLSTAEFVLVPKEPTVAMCRAAAPWILHYHMMRPVDKTNALIDAYKAMLLAARKEQS